MGKQGLKVLSEGMHTPLLVLVAFAHASPLPMRLLLSYVEHVVNDYA